jgi:hypothetical protein
LTTGNRSKLKYRGAACEEKKDKEPERVEDLPAGPQRSTGGFDTAAQKLEKSGSKEYLLQGFCQKGRKVQLRDEVMTKFQP